MEGVGDFSKVLQSVGGMGWWQTRNLILSSIRSSIHYNVDKISQSSDDNGDVNESVSDNMHWQNDKNFSVFNWQPSLTWELCSLLFLHRSIVEIGDCG